MNPAFTRIMGYEKSEITGSNPRLWKSDRHPAEFYDDMWHSLLRSGQWRGEIWNRHKDGSLIPEMLTINSVSGDDGSIVNFVAVYSDISTIKKSQAELEHLAHNDMLTALPNRVLFNSRLQHAIDHAERQKTRLAIIFLDLDQFKHINDSFGHNAGDQLLMQSAKRLKNLVRKDDTVARIGGDEFTFLLEDISEPDNILPMLEKILNAFATEFSVAGHQLSVTPSLGISIYPEDGRDTETLLRNADTAMYRAKAEGRNTCHFYTESLTAHALEHMQIEGRLRSAIDSNELQVYYQPQVSLVIQLRFLG